MKKFGSLSGFIAALILLALPAFAQQPNNGMNPTDAKILRDVQQKITEHPSLKDVKPSVEDRLVTLTGSVNSFYDKIRAGHILGNVNDQEQGVRNLLTVNTPAIPDDKLRNDLADRLRYDRIDRGIMFNNFTLQVRNGNVTIGGQARTDVDKDSALDIVETAKGVKNVVDNIQVLPTSNFDDDLRIRIARAIYGSPTLSRYANDPQAPIRIVVDNGHVTLDGVVDNQADKTLAASQANSVPGVFSVQNNLIVANGQNMASKTH
jgi:osmotically-inducible protein OsmY